MMGALFWFHTSQCVCVCERSEVFCFLLNGNQRMEWMKMRQYPEQHLYCQKHTASFCVCFLVFIFSLRQVQLFSLEHRCGFQLWPSRLKTQFELVDAACVQTAVGERTFGIQQMMHDKNTLDKLVVGLELGGRLLYRRSWKREICGGVGIKSQIYFPYKSSKDTQLSQWPVFINSWAVLWERLTDIVIWPSRRRSVWEKYETGYTNTKIL